MSTSEHQPVPPAGGRYPPAADVPVAAATPVRPESNESAVSWGAILAGATVSAALSLILLVLGMGLGMSAVSPWASQGIDADTFGWATITWISITSIIAAGLGGYLAGRLRTKWVSVHADESYFRDTAHGFLSWAVATLLTAALLTSAVGAIISGGVQAGASAAGSAAGGIAGIAQSAADDEDDSDVVDYFVDRVLRSNSDSRAAATQRAPMASRPGEDGDMQRRVPMAAPTTGDSSESDAQVRRETMGIFGASLRHGRLDDEDARYLAQIVAGRTDMSQQEAQARVQQVYADLTTELDQAGAQARELADEAREATAYGSFWLFISLLLGAFFASLMATFGGRQRDL